MAMSLAALGLVAGHAVTYGIVHEADEGTAAHLFQLLMVAQLPVIAWFAVRWVPRAPRPSLVILGVQLALGLAAIGAVYWLT